MAASASQSLSAVGSGPNSLVVADFDGDGHPDLAVANQNDGDVSILLGTGTGSFGPQTTFAAGPGPTTVAVGDFNGDGQPDLAFANYGNQGAGNTVSILLGAGTGSFGPPTTFAVGGGPFVVAVGDFNEDGQQDLAVGYYDSGGTSGVTVDVLLATGPGTFGAPASFAVGTNPVSIAVADFNGDGHLDLAVGNRNSSFVSVLLGDGTGAFGAQTTFATLPEPYGVAVGDFNADGLPDLVVTDYKAGAGSQVTVLLDSCQ